MFVFLYHENVILFNNKSDTVLQFVATILDNKDFLVLRLEF